MANSTLLDHAIPAISVQSTALSIYSVFRNGLLGEKDLSEVKLTPFHSHKPIRLHDAHYFL